MTDWFGRKAFYCNILKSLSCRLQKILKCVLICNYTASYVLNFLKNKKNNRKVSLIEIVEQPFLSYSIHQSDKRILSFTFVFKWNCVHQSSNTTVSERDKPQHDKIQTVVWKIALSRAYPKCIYVGLMLERWSYHWIDWTYQDLLGASFLGTIN